MKVQKNIEGSDKRTCWRYKKWVRILAGILCILSFNVMVGSLVGCIAMEYMGIYDKDKEDVKKEVFDSVLADYSIMAMTDYQDDFGMEKLSDTNFRYGVIQTDSMEGLDLNDKSIYEVCNFDTVVTEDMLHVYSCNMGETTGYEAGDSIFDDFYIYNQDREYKEVNYPIEGCYYVRNTRKLYYLANGKLYEQAGEGDVDNSDMEQIKLSDEIEKSEKTDKTGEYVYTWKNPDTQILVSDMTYYLSDITIVTSKELELYGEIVPLDDTEWVDGFYYIKNGEIVVYESKFVSTKPYYVLSYVNEPLADDDYLTWGIEDQILNWDEQDFFIQVSAILDMLYFCRYGIYMTLFISVIVFFMTLAIVLTGAGHENGYDGIKEGGFVKIPYDILICCVTGIVFVLLVTTIYIGMEFKLRLTLMIGLFCVVGSEWLVLRFLESSAIRWKKGKWWRNTLIYMFWNWCRRLCKKSVDWCREKGGKLSQAIPFLWKAWSIMGALAFLECIGLLATSYQVEEQLLLWFFEKVVLYAGLTVCLLQLYKLQQGAKKLADGETDSRIDTEKMFWDFKEHGENLNRIQEGIGKAVAEKMKSERFKTELITNVSHDIKTPLTSIINYVDLLEKEDIENSKVQEYLEVLSRQSTRLKKLIEDLIEASKASTGNLAVAYECCDAQVMLTQTIGEFEEKLQAAQIELIVQNGKLPVFIQADPRHLWRIFENLMNNICKYAQPSTRAYVNIEKEGQRACIIFRNISKYALNIGSDELMERFVRGDSSRTTEGNGLGLSIAKNLTEVMQGTFELVIDGDLFKVIVTFPLVEQKTDEL